MAKSKDKKWIENTADEYLLSYDFVVESEKDSLINFTKEICKKILEEVEKSGFVYFGTQTVNKLKEIIKDLGVDL